MIELRERIANERRRLRLVRLKMIAGIEAQAKGDAGYVKFYTAAADYIDATMQRLHEQDVKMGKMIREKADAAEDDIEAALEQLDERLAGAKVQLKQFLEARDTLKEKGAAALESFEAAGRKYSDYVVANMGHHDASAGLARKLFSPGDWEYMADITDEQQEHDERLFGNVIDLSPDAVKHISE